MKKRVLSMVLALALCLTVFQGIAFGAVSVDSMLTKAGNVLDSAIEGQHEVLASVAASDKVAAPASLEDADWAAFVDALVKEEIFQDENVKAYFVLRYLQVNPELIEGNEELKEAVAELELADEEINTANMGIKESVDSFDVYQDRLTLAMEAVGVEGALKLAELGFADIDNRTIVANETIVTFAKSEALKSLDLVKNIAFSTTGAELKAAYDAFMSDDIAKKTGAILMGKKLLKELTGGLNAAAKDFAKSYSVEIVDLFNAYKGTAASVDTLEAVKAVHEAGAKMADVVGAISDGKIGTVNALLQERGLTAVEVYSAVTDLANALDPEGKFRAVCMDLAVSRALELAPTTVQSGQNFNIKLWHRAFANYGINQKYDVTDLLYAETDSDKVKIELVDNSYQLTFGSDAPDSVVLTLYRNKAEASDLDPLRYVTKKTINLIKPEPVERAISITSGIDGQTFKVNEEVLIKGETTEFEEVVVSVIKPGETEAVYYGTVSAEKYASEGVTLTFDKAGEYKVIVGDNDKSATAAFTVVAEEEPAKKEVTITSPVDGSEYKPGEITFKGTSTGFEELVVSVIKPGETEAVYYGTVSAEKYASEGIVLNLTAEGEYTVIVGDAEVNTTVTFTIASDAEDKTVTITSPADGSVYTPGEITFKGTSTGFEELTISVIKPTGAAYYGTISAEKYASEGLVLNLTALGQYTVIVGDAEVNATVTFTISLDELEKYVYITKEAVNAEYLRGDTVIIKGESKGFEEIVVSILDPAGKAEYYGTYSPAKFAEGIEVTIPADAEFGTYKILVGETGENTDTVIYNDSVTFDVVETITTTVKLVQEIYKPTSTSISKNSSFEALLKKLPKNVTLVDENGKTIEVEITWDAETSGYNPAATGKQTVRGYYTIPEGYTAGEGVDGVVEVTVTRSIISPGPGGTNKYINLDTDAVAKNVYVGQTVTIKGTSRGYDTITVSITKPDGTKETLDLTATEFKDGYEYALTVPGEYTITVGGTSVKVVAEAVSSDIFEKGKHSNYILGYEDGTIRPEANVTREEITTILFRLLTDESREAWLADSTDKFSDVEKGRWSMTSIATLNNIGILNGYEDGTFRPGNSITRAEFAALLSRLVQVKPAEAAVDYKDIDGHWAASDIRVVSAEGWFQGDDEGNFRPNDKITRAEAVTVMNRILGRNHVVTDTIKNVEIIKFSDLAEDAWYYVDMVEAANAHSYAKDEAENESWKGAEQVTDWSAKFEG